jgi:hypothetical protein
MNDDYLWDKTGPPDPEIQQLEELLGTLRYQPRPLAMARNLPPRRRQGYFPLLAIAATLLVALLAGGIWMRMRPVKESQRQAQTQTTPAATDVRQALAVNANNNDGVVPENKPAPLENRFAGNKKRRPRSATPVLAKHEREEALAVKEQLMLALRMASEKLNLAHRKTQSPAPVNQIKNQHRSG